MRREPSAPARSDEPPRSVVIQRAGSSIVARPAGARCAGGVAALRILLCLTVGVHVTALMQATPQRVERVTEYRFCVEDDGRHVLVAAEGYRIEGVTGLRSESTETVWRRGNVPEGEGPSLPPRSVGP